MFRGPDATGALPLAFTTGLAMNIARTVSPLILCGFLTVVSGDHALGSFQNPGEKPGENGQPLTETEQRQLRDAISTLEDATRNPGRAFTTLKQLGTRAAPAAPAVSATLGRLVSEYDKTQEERTRELIQSALGVPCCHGSKCGS